MMLKTTSSVAFFFLAGAFALPMNTSATDTTTHHGYLPRLPSFDSYNVVVDNGTGTWPYRTYQSTNMTSPVFNVTKTSPNLASGFIFLTVNDFEPTAEHQKGPYIITSSGELVWAGGDLQAGNLRTQTLNGEEVITYWETTSASGGGYGKVEILNQAYEVVGTVCPKINVKVKEGANTSCVADIHESYITEQGTMIITVYNITTTNLTSVGGPATGWVYDSLAVEVDITTNEVLWSWSALEHVPITASKLELGSHGSNSSDPWSWFHMNSIQPFRDRVYVNSRETWQSYYVNRNGSIEWMIDGATGGDFGPLPDEGRFSWQHHARVHPSPSSSSNPNELLLTYFADNNDLPTTHNSSTPLGLLVTLPPNPSNPPKLWSHLQDPEDNIAAFAEGSYQLLNTPKPTRNTSNAASKEGAFVGYGTSPTMKEFNADGDVVYSADFGYRNLTHLAESYRAFKSSWEATPSTTIDLVIKPVSENGTCAARGYVSWNGATDVKEYIVFDGDMKPVGRFGRKGFETVFEVPEGLEAVQVGAVDGRRLVGMSEVVQGWKRR